MCTEKKRFEKKGKNTFNLLALGYRHKEFVIFH